MIRELLTAMRRSLGSLITRRRWLPGMVSITWLAIAVGVSLASENKLWIVGAFVPTFLTAFIWGYIKRALRSEKFPPLTHLQRRQYSETWNALAGSLTESYAAVAGQHDESSLRHSSLATVRNLVELLAISPKDDVLEIGCGIGRIGHELAPHCRNWTGADISSNMLNHARTRLHHLKNVHLTLLQDVSLSVFPDSVFDAVYMTNMLMHLDEMDRWRYVSEALRVLLPSGRLFFDNVDIESDQGWRMFANDAKRYSVWQRPPYMPRYSTSAELMAYANRAGFESVCVHHRPPLAIVTARKAVSAKTGRTEQSAAPASVRSVIGT